MVANRKSPRLLTTKKGQEALKSTRDVKRTQRLPVKTAPSIVTNGDKGITIKEEEVLYFGIPLEPGNTKKKLTKAQPFSFEVRNKELQMKKQERLKRMKDLEQQQVATHAPFLRNTVKPANKPLAPNNSMQKIAKLEVTNAQSQHLSQKHKQIIKKGENIKRLGVIAKKQDLLKLKTLTNKSLTKSNLTNSASTTKLSK